MNNGARSVLLVEDDEDDAEFAILALRAGGVSGSIDVVRDGEEALAYLQGAGADPPRSLPCLVLLDVKLPKIDGFEILRRLREDRRTRTLPVVMLSSSDICEDIARAYELGANSYVRKPVDFPSYEKTLRRVGEYWIHINEPTG